MNESECSNPEGSLNYLKKIKSFFIHNKLVNINYILLNKLKE